MIAIDAAGGGDPLVLLHGVGASRGIWRRVIGELQADRRVLTPDLPGFGESAPVGRGFRLEDTADALADALCERVTEPFDLVGNSLGGSVALVLARRRPGLVRRLVLVAPAGFSPAPGLVSSAAGWFSGPAIALRRRLGSPLTGSARVRQILLWGAIAEPQHLPAGAAREMLQASRGSSRVGAAVTAILQADLRSELAGLDVPLGLIWGERDRVVPMGTLRSILELCPEAAVETIPDGSHVLQVERPAEFVAALRRVLERL